MEFRAVGDRGLKGKSRMKLGKGDEDDGVREGVVIGRGGISGGRRRSVDGKGWQVGVDGESKMRDWEERGSWRG